MTDQAEPNPIRNDVEMLQAAREVEEFLDELQLRLLLKRGE